MTAQDSADATQSQSLNGAAVHPNYSEPISLLALPRDLLEQILLQLDPQDLVTSALISRLFKTIIHSSIALRYHIACHAAGVIDNSHCKISYAERYNALLKRERAWSRLQPVFSKTFDVPHKPASIYGSTTGVYLSDYIDEQDFRYCALPSTPDDVPQWIALHGHDPSDLNWNGTIISVGMAIYEHDLIIMVIASPLTIEENPTMHSLDMIVLQLSTGEYHPLAHFPRIHVENFYAPFPNIAVEVVGNTLAMIINMRSAPEDRLFVLDWKAGYKRLDHEASTDSLYSSLTFLSPEILLVPDAIRGQYEVWKIPVEVQDSPHQILSLRLPALFWVHSILRFYCHAAPNPYFHDQPHAPPRPFQNSVEDPVIINTIYLHSRGGGQSLFVFVTHRRSLLNTISNLTRADKPISSYPQNLIHQNFTFSTDEPGRSPRIRCSLSFPITTETLTGQSSQLGDVYGVGSIPWSEWGPPISRWFGSDVGGLMWIPSSSGQRWAVLDNRPTGNRRLKIIDFNPYNVYRAQDSLAGEVGEVGEVVVQQKGEYFDHDNTFAEDIKMGLGCVVHTAPEMYDFRGVLMDEERLLGLTMNEQGNVEKITVIYFG